MFNQLMADWGKVCWSKNWSSALESWNNFFFCITKLGGSWRKVIYALEFDLNEVKRIESRCERKMFFWHKMILGDISVLENVVSCEMCTVLNKVWMKCKKAKCIFHIPNLFSLSSKPPAVGNFLNRKKFFFRIELVMASHC